MDFCIVLNVKLKKKLYGNETENINKHCKSRIHTNEFSTLNESSQKDSVENDFEQLVDTTFYREFESDLSRLLDYFEETWIGKIDRNGKRKNPKSSINIWNYYSNEHNIPKTNNSVEGWHNGFSSILNAVHPNIWNFIKALQKEEKLNRLKMIQYCSGTEPSQKRKKYKDTAERITKICQKFHERTFQDYVSGIAHNL